MDSRGNSLGAWEGRVFELGMDVIGLDGWMVGLRRLS